MNIFQHILTLLLIHISLTASKISGPATAFTTSTNRPNHSIPDLKVELIWLNPGAFTMGSPSDEEFRNKAEGPQTHVTLTKGFWLAKTELTQAQYESITGQNPSTFKNIGPDAPVENVSWIDAMAYCEKLNQRERGAGRLPEGYSYTLPTEAQWEYACRAGTATAYTSDPGATAWYDNNSTQTTHPVAQKRPNRWGFHDITGNIIEWCYDWYGNYPGGSVTDPTGPRHGYYRIARGGSWRTEERTCRSAARSGGSAARLDYTIGFRLALSATIRNEK
jgi:formylglycine-generating enzyme required for sulfatase activity